MLSFIFQKLIKHLLSVAYNMLDYFNIYFLSYIIYIYNLILFSKADY